MMKRRGGFSLIEVLVVIGIVALLVALTLAAVQRVRDAANRSQCANRQRQVGIALHQYHNVQGSLPPGISLQEGRAQFRYMSWCTRLLPHLEQDALWRKEVEAYGVEPIRFWHPPHVGDRANPLFICPSEPRETYYYDFPPDPPIVRGFTHFLGVEGINQDSRDGLLFVDSSIQFAQIADGASNTIMVGERPPGPDGAFPGWNAAHGLDKTGSAAVTLGVREIASEILASCFPLNERLQPANPFQPGRRDSICDCLHFWSNHSGGANFLFADGSVRFLSYSADRILPALATRAGGEAVELP